MAAFPWPASTCQVPGPGALTWNLAPGPARTAHAPATRPRIPVHRRARGEPGRPAPGTIPRPPPPPGRWHGHVTGPVDVTRLALRDRRCAMAAGSGAAGAAR